MQVVVSLYKIDKSTFEQSKEKYRCIYLDSFDDFDALLTNDTLYIGTYEDKEEYTVLTNDSKFKKTFLLETHTFEFTVPEVEKKDTMPEFGITFDDNFSVIQENVSYDDFKTISQHCLLWYWNLNGELVSSFSKRTIEEVEKGLEHVASKGYLAPISVKVGKITEFLNFLNIPYYHKLLGSDVVPFRFFVYKDIKYLEEHFPEIYENIKNIPDNKYFTKISNEDVFDDLLLGQEEIRNVVGEGRYCNSLYFFFNNTMKNRELLDRIKDNIFLNPVIKYSGVISCYSVSDFVRYTEDDIISMDETISTDTLPVNVELIKDNLPLNCLSHQFEYVQYKDRYNVPEESWVTEHNCDVAIFEDMCMPLNLHRVQEFLNRDIVIKQFRRKK